MNFINWLTDKVAVFLAIGVGVATVATMFASFPHNPVFSLIMAILGGVLVLFQAQALVKRMNGLWRLLGLIIIFSDVSWFVTMADTGHKKQAVQIVVDPELTRLQTELEDAKAHQKDLTEQLASAQNRVTIDTIAGLLTGAQAQVTAALNGRNAYHAPEGEVESQKLFLAIPNAVLDPSQWIALIVGLCVAVALQWTILAVLRGAVKRAKSEERAATGPRRRTRRRKPSTPPAEVPTLEAEPDMGGNL